MTRIGDLAVSRVGLGCMGMSMTYGRPDAASARATLDRALELGITLFDTAAMYGRGRNERFLGEHLAPRRASVRDRIVIATKWGLGTNLLGMPNSQNGTPEHCRASVEQSLRRLGVEEIDLLYLHRVDPKVPVEESVSAMAELVTAGTVREIGLSEATAEEIRRARTVHPIAALQSEWSLFSRDIEDGPLQAARETGTAIVPYSPLGRGMLTGAARSTTRLPLLDYRRFLPRWRRSNLRANLAAVTRVERIARRHGATAGQVALAWVLAQGTDVVPIPGTTRPENLESNWQAQEIELGSADLAALDDIRPAGERTVRYDRPDA